MHTTILPTQMLPKHHMNGWLGITRSKGIFIIKGVNMPNVRAVIINNAKAEKKMAQAIEAWGGPIEHTETHPKTGDVLRITGIARHMPDFSGVTAKNFTAFVLNDENYTSLVGEMTDYVEDNSFDIHYEGTVGVAMKPELSKAFDEAVSGKAGKSIFSKAEKTEGDGYVLYRAEASSRKRIPVEIMGVMGEEFDKAEDDWRNLFYNFSSRRWMTNGNEEFAPDANLEPSMALIVTSPERGESASMNAVDGEINWF